MTEINPLLTQRPTINPYRYGAFEIWNRLKWDMNIESFKSRKKLKALKDKYLNNKAVIVCNGPSLLKTDLSLLDNVFTFGLNKINLLFDKSYFRPSCIIAVNNLVIEQNAAFYNQTDIPLFLDSYAVKFVHSRENVTFLHSSTQSKFSTDCSMSISPGHTVTFVGMQLAFHMGFTNVTLIGCDHNFAVKGSPNMKVVSGDKDESHFDPNYFAGGVKWQLPDLFQSEVNYTLARNTYEAHRRKIVNSTEGGYLEILSRIKLENFIR